MDGTSIKDLSLTYKFTVNTITRQLKQQIGEKQFIRIRKINSAKISKANNKLIDKSDSLLEHNKSEILNKILTEHFVKEIQPENAWRITLEEDAPDKEASLKKRIFSVLLKIVPPALL